MLPNKIRLLCTDGSLARGVAIVLTSGHCTVRGERSPVVLFILQSYESGLLLLEAVVGMRDLTRIVKERCVFLPG